MCVPLGVGEGILDNVVPMGGDVAPDWTMSCTPG